MVQTNTYKDNEPLQSLYAVAYARHHTRHTPQRMRSRLAQTSKNTHLYKGGLGLGVQCARLHLVTDMQGNGKDTSVVSGLRRNTRMAKCTRLQSHRHINTKPDLHCGKWDSVYMVLAQSKAQMGAHKGVYSCRGYLCAHAVWGHTVTVLAT